jgi:hypothetical protein
MKGVCQNLGRDGALLRPDGAARRTCQRLFGQGIDSLGQTKIKLGQATFAVR